MSINIEIKARTSRAAHIRKFLLDNGADFKGTDLQIDTYFQVTNGRLKLREGNIENNLIYYIRKNQAGPRQSDFILMPVNQPAALKDMLQNALGVKVIVQKRREIYFIGNIKFHLDQVEGLGEFVEIEASNTCADFPPEILRQQCEYYQHALGIEEIDLVKESYCDLLKNI